MLDKSNSMYPTRHHPSFLYLYPECQGSVPQAITAFLESNDFVDAVRKAISLGGDSDTIACIADGIAEAFYGGVPVEVAEKVRGILDERLGRVVVEFTERIQ